MNVKTLFHYKNHSDILSGEVSRSLVSIIVPVYKVEDVLPRCLDSLRRQSLREIEIILVDDASPDRCGEICEQYAAEDGRIRVFHHPKNRGLSAARNTGIAYASADYLMFVDGDDWVHVDFCKLPYECAVQQQADLVMFCHRRIEKNGLQKPVKQSEDQFFGKLSHVQTIELLSRGIINYPWNKLYSRKLFNNVSYPEGYFYEGTGVMYKTVLLADTVFYLDKVLYYYCFREGSITTLKTKKALRDYFEMHMQQYHDLDAWSYPKDKLKLMLIIFSLTYCIRGKNDANDARYAFCRRVLQSAKQIPEGFTWKRKVLFLLLKYCPPLFELVCDMGGKRW